MSKIQTQTMSVTCFPECLERLRECIRRESRYPFSEDGMRIYEKFVTAPPRTCWIGPRRTGHTTALLFYVSCALHMHDGLPICIVVPGKRAGENFMERLKTAYVMPEDVPLLETNVFRCRDIFHARKVASEHGRRARLVLGNGDVKQTIDDDDNAASWIVSMRCTSNERYTEDDEEDKSTNIHFIFDTPDCTESAFNIMLKLALMSVKSN